MDFYSKVKERKCLKNKYVFLDAETDGLYGQFLTVALVAVSDNGQELEKAYYGICKENMVINDNWVKENVLPILGTYENCADEDELLDKTWNFWMKYSDSAYVVADVPFPVEARLFESCVRKNVEDRKFKAPFPLMDLSSMLYVKGYDPLMERNKIIEETHSANLQHNALYDVELSIQIWKKIK